MTPLQKIKHLIDLGEQAFAAMQQVDTHEFNDATEMYLDSLTGEIHRIVKEYGLQKAYYDMTNATAFEGVADAWLEKNPFNPEESSVKV